MILGCQCSFWICLKGTLIIALNCWYLISKSFGDPVTYFFPFIPLPPLSHIHVCYILFWYVSSNCWISWWTNINAFFGNKVSISMPLFFLFNGCCAQLCSGCKQYSFDHCLMSDFWFPHRHGLPKRWNMTYLFAQFVKRFFVDGTRFNDRWRSHFSMCHGLFAIFDSWSLWYVGNCRFLMILHVKMGVKEKPSRARNDAVDQKLQLPLKVSFPSMLSEITLIYMEKS